jgi:glyoxylase-like metal-dependent hydrolase (beta-lactamase superfamily II)
MDERLRRAAGIRSLSLGDTTVTYVPDGEVRLGARGWLPDTGDAVWAERPEYVDEAGNLVASIGGLLVEHGDRALLIDAGFGPQAWPAEPSGVRGDIHGGALLDNLAALGRKPAEIEVLAITHLHVDHLGWAYHPAPGSDSPAFTGAEYLVSEPEWAERDFATTQGTGREILDVLQPRVRTVAEGEEIFPGVRVVPAPGHTPGHTAYVISGGGRRVIAFGDAFHSAIQMEHPEWWAAPDHDRGRSTSFRLALVDELAAPGTVGFGVHFADVVFGRVEAGGDRPAWRPVDD